MKGSQAKVVACCRGHGYRLALVAVGLGLVLSGPFFLKPLRPWTDQGWMLQAAMRHAQGEGLTGLALNPDDLAAPRPQPLIYFPPLYPLAVSALLQCGLPVEAAVKGINATALVLGVCGWLRLAGRWLRAIATLLLFAALLLVSGGTLVPKGGTADYILWAAMPWWLALILSARQVGRPYAGWLSVLAASALVGGLIGVRWAAVVLIPAGSLVLLWPDGHRGFASRALRAACFALPAACVYFLITAINSQRSGAGGDLLAFVQPGWRWHLLWTPYPLEALTSIPLALEPLLHRFWQAVDAAKTNPFLAGLARVGGPLFLLVGLAWVWRRSGKAATDRWPGELWLAGSATILATVLFLAFMTVRYTWDFVAWSYLDEPRYFRPLWPLAALLALTAVERLPRHGLRTAAGAVLFVGCLYLLQGHIRNGWRAMTQRDESLELVEQVRSLGQRQGPQVVFDIDVSDYVLSPEPNVLTFLYPDSNQVAHLKAVTAADLWLVRRVQEKTAYLLDKEADARRFAALADRFGAARAWVSSGGNYELYHARVPPQPLTCAGSDCQPASSSGFVAAPMP